MHFISILLQTPYQQTDKLDLNKNPEYISAGGGFGPVSVFDYISLLLLLLSLLSPLELLLKYHDDDT